MSRPWSSIIVIACLIATFGVLGVLQYRWLSQINESEGEKAQKHVQEQAEIVETAFSI